MKIFVMVDMEGISGVVLSTQVSKDGQHYEQSRRYMTWDVNACVRGCFEGGATHIRVRDAHGSGYNLIWDELDSRAEYIQGSSDHERQPGIGAFDGLILLGYHAMGGTAQGILEHTMSSRSWQNCWMNGIKVGEIAQDAAIAGDHGVPAIMVSGDNYACREARRFIPGITTVEVKKGLACQGGLLYSKEKAHERIRRGAAESVAAAASRKPFRVRHPVTMRLELVSRGHVPDTRPGVRVIDGRTYEVKAATVEEALNLL